MELTVLQEKILQTLARFSVLNRPLTFLELIEFLDHPFRAEDVLSAISEAPLKQMIRNESGWLCLSQDASPINRRQEHHRFSIEKIRLAKRAVAWLKYFPWIRGIAFYSSLSLKNSQKHSDIDLFFITAPERAWSARFFVNVFMKLFGLRPTDQKTENKLCPSYFATEACLNLSIANLDDDYYYYYFGAGSFVFIYSTDEIKNKFEQANDWVKQILPNHHWPKLILETHHCNLLAKKIVEAFAGLLPEKTLKKWQLRILPIKYLRACDGKKVILDNNLIKLHNNDKRRDLNELFANKIKELSHAPTDNQ